MEKSINKIYSEFSYHFDDVYQRSVQFYVWCLSRADPRVEKWPLMASPVPTLLFTFAYLLVVYYGRRWMKNRKPFSLRYILVPYNLSMCLLNFYIALELAVTQYRKQYNWFCQPVNYSNDPDDIRKSCGDIESSSKFCRNRCSLAAKVMTTESSPLTRQFKMLTHLKFYLLVLLH